MLQITPQQVSPELASLLDLSMPTGIRALAVLAGGNTGRIFTDDPAHPQWTFVWEADDGTLYRGGHYGRKVLSDVVTLLRQEGLVALGFRDGDPDMELFPLEPQAGAECLEFERPLGSSDLTPYLDQLPPGYALHRMDRTLLERSPKNDENLNRYGSLENLLEKGIAVCILHGEDIVCEAYADMDIMGMREIGVSTQEAHRRQGLATLTCATLINLCEQAGSRTYWDCARLNAGSVSLARKLGFQNERAYKRLAWFKPLN
jgi:RimJ/RimL family protein N-acetyltransferase